MRSLNELLHTEEVTVKAIEHLDDEARKAMEDKARIEAYPLECDGKKHDLERKDEELYFLNTKREALETELTHIRGKIRDYFNMIMFGETKRE